MGYFVHTFGGNFWILLRYFYDTLGIFLGNFLNTFWILLEYFYFKFGILLRYFGILLGYSWAFLE